MRVAKVQAAVFIDFWVLGNILIQDGGLKFDYGVTAHFWGVMSPNSQIALCI